MKIKKIVAIIAASAMLALCLVSCGGAAADINVNVKIVTNDAEHPDLLDTTLTVPGDAKILDIIDEACRENDIAVTYTEDDDAIQMIGIYDSVEGEGGVSYYWTYTVNGREVLGSAADNTLKDGDTLEYKYVESKSRFVIFRAIVDGEVIIEEQVTEGRLINVLEAACDSFELDESGEIVMDIGDYETKIEDGYSYYWTYTVNGKEVKDPDASQDKITSGTVVEYTYVVEEVEEVEE